MVVVVVEAVVVNFVVVFVEDFEISVVDFVVEVVVVVDLNPFSSKLKVVCVVVVETAAVENFGGVKEGVLKIALFVGFVV